MTALREAIDAAQRSDHWFSLYYTFCACRLPALALDRRSGGDTNYLDMTVNSAADDRWKRCWALILRLRQGGARDALIASFLEPRLDLSTSSEILAIASLPTISVPWPNDDAGDALWCLPEVLRVNAELLLWHGALDATAAAESKLLRSLDLARQQSTLRGSYAPPPAWHGYGTVAAAWPRPAACLPRHATASPKASTPAISSMRAD